MVYELAKCKSSFALAVPLYCFPVVRLLVERLISSRNTSIGRGELWMVWGVVGWGGVGVWTPAQRGTSTSSVYVKNNFVHLEASG